MSKPIAVVGMVLLAGSLYGITAQAQQASKTLTMQASWPASSTFMDNFNQFADRVNKTTGGRLQIKTSPAGQIVPAFEVTDATHKGVLDGAHTWSGYLIGKHPAAVLFTGGPGGNFGMDFVDVLGWMYEGGHPVIALVVVMLFPEIALWFPRWLFE